MTVSGSRRKAQTRPRARRGDGLRLRDEILEATERLMLASGDADAVSIRAVAKLELRLTIPCVS